MNDIIKVLNGMAFTESQEVAERFNKDHKNVLATIDRTIRDLTAVKSAVKDYFIEGTFTNARNRDYRNYLMTREGFALVAMTLEGPESMKFKIEFLDAFKLMARTLREQSTARAIGKEIRKTLTEGVKESGENERMHGHGYSNYTKFAYKTIGIKYVKPGKGEPNFRDTLPPGDLERLKTVESMIKALLDLGNKYDEVKKTISEIYEPKQLLKG